MSEDINYRMRQWQPPARPEWVRRLNAEGAHLDLKSVVPLDADSLIACAKRNTGLSDFGDDDWETPFRKMLESFENESGLHLMGRLMTRSDVLMLLEARLRVEDLYRRHPEIEDERIVAPILIIGSGRCGTSAMQNLLAAAEGNGTPMQWECLFPVPPPEPASYAGDPRIALADARITQWNRVTPEIATMHEFAGNIPSESIALEALSFECPAWLHIFGFMPGFIAWMAERGVIGSLSYAKRVMKLLQWKNPRERWILKSPDAMRYLPDFLRVFPDARLVWMHRDPLKAVSSLVNLIGTLYWIRSDRRLPENTIAQLTNPAGLAAMLEQGIDWIENGQIPRAQVCSLHYRDFMADPVACVERLYAHFDIPLTDAARASMATYMRANPRENRPAHRYSSGDAARQSDERRLFARYQSYFGIESEI